MRSSIIAKAGAAAAAVFAATGGLAVAHALPASMQDAASEIGIGAPARHGHHAHEAIEVEPEHSTTTVEHETTTVPGHDNDAVEHERDDDDRGAVVGAHEGDNDDQGENECEAEEQNERDDDEMTSTSVPCVPTTETTVPEAHDGNRGDNNEGEHPTVTTVPEAHDGNEGPSDSSGPGSADEQHTTTPTTTSHSGGGDDSNSGPGGGDSSHGG